MTLIYVAFILALSLTLLLGTPYLSYLKKNLYGQSIREDGPESHAKKAGTPTTGGVIIVLPAVIAIIITSLMEQQTSIEALIVVATFIFSMFMGLQDDVIKITKKQNKGLSAIQKIFLQLIIAAIPVFYMTFLGYKSVIFFDILSIDLGFLYPLFGLMVIIGTSNAVNLTDGLDGLASGTSFIAFLGATVICLIINRIDLAIVACAIAGSCLAFLYFNRHPAKVFMGDTGSLAIGTALGALAVVGKFEMWLLILGGVFVMETLSVILQVISFKTTKKRIFKMSPIHHHFELSGWSETKVVYVFWAVGLILAIIACVAKSYAYFNL